MQCLEPRMADEPVPLGRPEILKCVPHRATLLRLGEGGIQMGEAQRRGGGPIDHFHRLERPGFHGFNVKPGVQHVQ